MLGLFAANSSLGFFLLLYSRVIQARFLGSVLDLFSAKLEEELDAFVLWVEERLAIVHYKLFNL